MSVYLYLWYGSSIGGVSRQLSCEMTLTFEQPCRVGLVAYCCLLSLAHLDRYRQLSISNHTLNLRSPYGQLCPNPKLSQWIYSPRQPTYSYPQNRSSVLDSRVPQHEKNRYKGILSGHSWLNIIIIQELVIVPSVLNPTVYNRRLPQKKSLYVLHTVDQLQNFKQR